MSIRTNKMKAVPLLLRRVSRARSIFLEKGRYDQSFDGKLEKLTQKLNKIKDVFVRVRKNEDELLDTLTEVDGHVRKLDRKRLDEEMDGICKRIGDCANKLLPMDASASEAKTKAFDSSQDHKSGKLHSDPSSTQHNIELLPMDVSQGITKPSDSSQDHKSEEVHSHLSSTQHNNHFLLDQDKNLLLERYRKLGYKLRACLLSLSIFPEDAVIKKRHTIYWWIGEWVVKEEGEKTAEEVGEEVIDELSKLNLIVPYGNAKSPLFNKFQINPHIRPHLESSVVRENAQHLGFYIRLPFLFRRCIVLEQHKVILGDSGDRFIYSVFNVGASYLNFESQWGEQKQNNLWVLQLGRWQDSPSHHIEVGSQEFLRDLFRDQMGLSYLSLRGISRIFELPPSIAQLERLKILDLKACHNLETLPNDISTMKSLTHLILSQCYLLDAMPKGIDRLTQLQVLKGFVLGSSSKTPYTISDLANLKELRRLSIHIGSEAVIKDEEFESLGELSALKHLKISWGVSRYSDIQIILPPSSKKLHLQGFPGQKIPEWLEPSKLTREFKELKIMGGKLKSMNHDEDMNKWGMEIVCLKYLKHLKLDSTNLKELSPSLRYAEIRQISNHSYFEWSID